MISGSKDSFTLRDAIGLLRRKIRVILLTVLLILGAAFTFLLIVSPQYSSTAWVFVDTAQKNLLKTQDGLAPSSASDNARIESEVLLLQSNTVALATIERASLYDTFRLKLSLRDKLWAAFNLAPQHDLNGEEILNTILKRVKKSTTIRRIGQTYLISVTATSKSPQASANLANALSRTYIDLQVQSKVDAALSSYEILEGQIDNAHRVLAETEGAFDRYIETNLERLSQESIGNELASLKTQFYETNDNFLTTKTHTSEATFLRDSEDWNHLSQSLQDTAIADLSQQFDELSETFRRADDQSKIDLRQKLTALDLDIRKHADASISALETETTALATSLRDQRAGLRTAVLNGALSPTSLAQIYQLQQEAEIAQRHYAKLLSRASDIQTQAYLQMADSRIVSAAIPPSTASFPNKRLILVLSIIIALFLGVGLAVLSEHYVGGVTSRIQLANILSEPVVASIPRVPLASSQHSVADNVIDAPLSMYAESLRLLRSAIDAHSQGKSSVIMVTSAVPTEGKSSVALGLARTYALSGKSTLLIDADLRKPSLHSYLNIAPRNSLLEFLDGETSDPEGFYTSDPLSNLGVIMGRDRANLPTEQLIQSEAFADLIRTARASMDIIILDTSPLLPVVDARYVLPLADVVVNCIRFSSTEQRDIRSAHSQLFACLKGNTPILSVLNFDENETAKSRYNGYYTKQ